jgi:hypothetical protein
MKSFISLCTFMALAVSVATAQPLIQPFDFVMPSYDSTHSDWLPPVSTEAAGAHGFVRVSGDGHLEFTDGTPVRFAGVSIIASACFPDSVGALATAARLQKLGINLVRFNYFDYSNSNGASTLAPGNRSDTLSASQMKRLDWFLYQLKQRGIYAHLVLKSRNAPRRDDGVPGWDSTFVSGAYITHFNEPFQRMQQRYMTALFNHVNPYTGLSYASDPAIALITVNDQNTIHTTWVLNRLNTSAGIMSYQHSRLLDTMFTNYLKKKYGTTAALKAAYWEGIPATGPNLLKNPGFESLYDNWVLTVLEGARAGNVLTQGPEAAPGDGPTSLRIVVQQVNGTEGRIYLQQNTFPLKRNGIYRLRFKAKTDLAAGRQTRIIIQGGSPNVNFGFNETVNITNAWTTYDYTFRSSGTDSLGTYIRFYLGREMGDLFLDGFQLQETGREGLAQTETLENYNVGRALFTDAPKISLPRMLDQVAFYDSLARSYERTMRAHLRSLGISVPIATNNSTVAAADTWTQQESDFLSETAQWDFNGTRPGAPGYSDSTWVVRNYSILNYRDQKVPEFSRAAVAGKPFIAESYNHVYPNIHRSEMMLFCPAYASLHDWDGAYLYSYNDRQTDLANRRQMLKDDFQGFMADPSVCALLPQFSAMLRNRWISPAARTIMLHHDANDLRQFPFHYSQRGTHNVEGIFPTVANLVSAVRIDSFSASRHYTNNDYYFTVPSDDNIQSDTKEITLDMTKGVMSLNTSHAQGASGALANMSAVRTDYLSLSWVDGGRHVTALWTSLDTARLATAGRSLLTVTTRAANTGAAWQFGDSSFGKNWGTAPVQMESVRLGVNFFTAADTLRLYPLDTLAQPTGTPITATRQVNGSWRATLDLATLKTPWFGVEQIFNEEPTNGVHGGTSSITSVGDIYPNPASGEALLPITAEATDRSVSVRIIDALGRTVATINEHVMVAGTSILPLDIRMFAAGNYTCIVSMGSMMTIRRMVVQR